MISGQPLPSGKERQGTMRALVMDNSLHVRQEVSDLIIDTFLKIKVKEADNNKAQEAHMKFQPDQIIFDIYTPSMNKTAMLVEIKHFDTAYKAEIFTACVKSLHSSWSNIMLVRSRTIFTATWRQARNGLQHSYLFVRTRKVTDKAFKLKAHTEHLGKIKAQALRRGFRRLVINFSITLGRLLRNFSVHIVSQKSLVPHHKRPWWDKTFLEIYKIISKIREDFD